MASSLKSNYRVFSNVAYLSEFRFGDLKFSIAQRDLIIRKWTIGEGKDVKRGRIQADGRVLWDGDHAPTEQMTKEAYVEGLKIMMKKIMNKVSRMNPETWRAFKFPLLEHGVWENFPTLDNSMDEFVLLEVDLTAKDDWDRAKAALEEFLRDCERVTQGIIQCKTRKRNVEKMTGKGGRKEGTINYLKSILVRQVFRSEVRI